MEHSLMKMVKSHKMQIALVAQSYKDIPCRTLRSVDKKFWKRINSYCYNFVISKYLFLQMVPLRPLCLKCLCIWKQQKNLCDTYEFITIVCTNTNFKNIDNNTKNELWGDCRKWKGQLKCMVSLESTCKI